MVASATPVLIGKGLQFAEGVNFGCDGTLYCVDLLGGGIWRMLPGEALRLWLNTGGRPNGTRFGPGGDLFVADRGIVHRSVSLASAGAASRTHRHAHRLPQARRARSRPGDSQRSAAPKSCGVDMSAFNGYLQAGDSRGPLPVVASFSGLLDRANRLVGENRRALLGICGPPGVGKTSLA
jgi:hypothetical protein